jgi:hypothetical protein
MRCTTLLARISENPILFLGGKNLDAVKAFVSGYAVCCYDNGVLLNGDREFQDYVKRRFKCNETTHWTTIIKNHSSNDDEAFSLFQSILNDYITSQSV